MMKVPVRIKCQQATIYERNGFWYWSIKSKACHSYEEALKKLTNFAHGKGSGSR
jgi:hypothetical protein